MTACKHVQFWGISTVVLSVLMYLFNPILLPFVLGGVIGYMLDPLCDKLEAHGLSRNMATTAVVGGFGASFTIAILLIAPLIVSQTLSLIDNLPVYAEHTQGIVFNILSIVEQHAEPVSLDNVRSAIQNSSATIIGWTTSTLTAVATSSVALINLISLLAITPVVSFYLIRDWDVLVGYLDSLIPIKNRSVVRELVKEVDNTLSGFIRGQSLVCLTLGIFYAVGLTAFGLNYGIVIGMIAGIISFVPFVGSLLGGAISIGLAFIQFGDAYTSILLIAAVFAVGQILEGNFLTPKFVGDRIGLHPVWVMFGLLAGGSLFGFVGMLVAVPVSAIIGVGVRFTVNQYKDSEFYHHGKIKELDVEENK